MTRTPSRAGLFTRLALLGALTNGAAGCGIFTGQQASIQSAHGRLGETGFGLGGIEWDGQFLTSAVHTFEVRVEHAAKVGPKADGDEVWKVLGPNLPPTIGVEMRMPNQTLVFCSGAASTSGERCQEAIEIEEDGRELGKVRGFPTFVDDVNLGVMAATGQSSDKDGTQLVASGVVADPTANEASARHSNATRSTPNFGVWVLTHPVTWVVTDPGIAPTRVGGPLMFCFRTDAGPRCRFVKSSQRLGHVLGVQTLRRSGRFEHVVWYREQRVPKFVRCHADDQEGKPMCQTIEVM